MAALTVIVVWCAFVVRDVLLLVYVSGLFAIGFSPVIRLIERQKVLPIGSRRLPRWLAILVLYVVIIGTLTGIGFMIAPPINHQSQQLWTALPDMFDRAQDFLISKGILKEHVTLTEAVKHAPASKGGEAVGTVVGAVASVVGGLFGLLTILILTFYILIEAKSLRGTLLHLFPGARTRACFGHERRHHRQSERLAQRPTAARHDHRHIVGIGLWLMGIPFFYVLALISGVGELIPVVGPVLSAIPAILIAATVSMNKVLLVIIFFVIQQQFENHVLVPKVMQRQVGVSPVTVIVALLIGGKLLGIVGAILAVPTAAILQVVLAEVFAARDKAGA